MSEDPIVFVVDDDTDVRKSLGRSLRVEGFAVESYASAEAFLDARDHDCLGCLILDLAMPGMNGLDLQAELLRREWLLPIIFISGHGDVPTSVQAIKEGAIEFLEKPFEPQVLFDRVAEAIERNAEARAEIAVTLEIRARYQTLTPRELEVLGLLVAGAANRSNKEVARELGISHRTVDEYRARIMAKMQARSITELAEFARRCDVV